MDESHDIVDIGVNLAHRSFHADREEVIGRAFAAGVRTMIVTGTSLAGSQEALRIAHECPDQLFATVGVHPHDSRNCTEDTIVELRRLATHKEVVAKQPAVVGTRLVQVGYGEYSEVHGDLAGCSSACV
jgi:TatD DNase family protein